VPTTADTTIDAPLVSLGAAAAGATPKPTRLDVKDERKMLCELARVEVMEKMPRPQAGGTFTFKGKEVSNAEARRVFKAMFPNSPNVYARSPDVRAREAKGQGRWTDESRAAARNCFFLGDVDALLYVHELVSYDELMEHDRYQVSCLSSLP
jgi:hypothetical protein